ncbi:hypothetical protein ACF0H5_004739 [Mactra antiquata]
MSRKRDIPMLQVVPSLSKDMLAQGDHNVMTGENKIKPSSSTSTQCYNDDDDDSYDILDLEKMTDKFENSIKHKIEQFLKDVDGDIYIEMTDEVYNKIKENDRLLKRSYDLLFEDGMEKFPHIEKKTKDMIKRLETKPHLYCPFERDGSLEDHVNRWLYNKKNSPVPELIGFSTNDPFQLERFIPSVLPRMSTSETNIALGKRKRSAIDDDEDDDGASVVKSSSDTRLVCNKYYRPTKRVRRS